MHRQTKATSIPPEAKEAVSQRDNGLCIICGAPGDSHCHVVRRSQGGMGIEENIVTLCPQCHYSLDEGLYMRRLAPLGIKTQQQVQNIVEDYMREKYPGWTREKVKYRKWG